MRSEERAGIISIVLLFLWGTLLAEPLHAFMNVFTTLISNILEAVGRNILGKIGGGFFLFILLALIIGLLFISRKRIAIYIPCVSYSLISIVYFIDCISKSRYDFNTVVSLSIFLAIIAVMHAFKLETPLIWMSDICIYTPAIYLVTGLVFMPLRALVGSWGKIFYITRYQNTNLALPFDGFMHLPAIVWGVFFAVIMLLPIIYFSFSRTKNT